MTCNNIFYVFGNLFCFNILPKFFLRQINISMYFIPVRVEGRKYGCKISSNKIITTIKKNQTCILRCFILFRFFFFNFFFVWTILGSYLNFVNFDSFFEFNCIASIFFHFSRVFTCFVFSLTYAFLLFLLKSLNFKQFCCRLKPC